MCGRKRETTDGVVRFALFGTAAKVVKEQKLSGFFGFNDIVELPANLIVIDNGRTRSHCQLNRGRNSGQYRKYHVRNDLTQRERERQVSQSAALLRLESLSIPSDVCTTGCTFTLLFAARRSDSF